MAKGVVDRDLGWEEIKEELEKLKSMAVKVGIVEGTGKNDNGADIAEYAYYNEVGTEHIPSRPFIRSWTDNKMGEIKKMLDSAYKHVADGKWTAEDAMKRIGQFAESGIKKNIKEGDFVPNSPATIRRKRSSRPLIDTGTMRNSIRYEVVKK